jgi:hypothetical protein
MAQEHPDPEPEPVASAMATAEPTADAPEPPAVEQPPQGSVPPSVWKAAQWPPNPIGPFGRFVRNRLTQVAAALLVGALIGGGTVALINKHNNGNSSNFQPDDRFGRGRDGSGYGQFPGGGPFGNGQQGNGFGNGSSSGSSQGGQGTGT